MSRRWSRAALAGAALAALLAVAGASSLVAPGHVDVLRGAANATLDLLSRAIADPAPVSDPQQAEELAHILSVVRWKNNLALFAVPKHLLEPLPQFVQSWLANCVLCYLEYFLSGALWALWIYKWYPNAQIEGKHPSWEAMKAQAVVSCKAIPLYTLLPPLSEHLILSGYTRAYGRISSVGLPAYFAHVALYMLSVEFGVYWQHRKLHEVKWAYKWLHRIHHVYNKEHTLSPFAGLAFHPLDGLLQAVPYVWTLFLVPCHYFTHEVLLFLTGVWTANIHDCIHGECEPIMGAAYHTIHHTTYAHNYGHYTTLFDGLFGTLQRPPPVAKALPAAEGKAAKAAAPASASKPVTRARAKAA